MEASNAVEDGRNKILLQKKMYRHRRTASVRRGAIEIRGEVIRNR